MPRTKLDGKKYVSLTEFAEYYGISKSKASTYLKQHEFDNCKRRLGEKTLRIDINEADRIMQMIGR